ncbi:hypothetical protein lerEdw1_020769 [Lerista edwardsae]|nr:hypothetical protein lerEdw1_020769 [Lerista edwardsae]
MECDMEVVENGEVPPASNPETRTAEEQASSQDYINVLTSQGALRRPRQRARQPDPARPWKSLPATPTGDPDNDQPVFFSSLTSLQAEEFFEMVAKAQARRLDDQRADFVAAEGKSEGNTVVSEEQLYDTILAHQSQRLEDQRTEPPIPVGIQGLLDLLLTAQGARMEDQRSALPAALTSPSLLGGPPTFPGQFVNPPADSSLEQMWF